MHGWIKLHRQLQDCWIWNDKEPFDKRSAWIDLLLLCNHTDNKMLFDGKLVVIKKGQYVTSVRKLSEKWHWSKDRCLSFLRLLENDGMITKDSDTRRTLLTIVNYELYQGCIDTDKDTNRTRIGQSFATNKNDKNFKNDKNTMCECEEQILFEHLWKLYPVKKGKAQVTNSTKLKLLKIGKEEMERAIERYKVELYKDREWRKPQNGNTFFNGGYVDYLDANYVPGNKTNEKNGFCNFSEQHDDYDFKTLEKELTAN